MGRGLRKSLSVLATAIDPMVEGFFARAILKDGLQSVKGIFIFAIRGGKPSSFRPRGSCFTCCFKGVPS